MHPHYREWIDYIFDNEEPVSGFLDLDEPKFAEAAEDQVTLITETFLNSGKDLTRFSDAQVNHGIWYLSSPASSDCMLAVGGGDVPIERRVAAVRSIYQLYRDCFAQRCTETLSHLNEPGDSSLNSICYMFWDNCSLGCLDNNPDAQALEDAIVGVLEQTVRIPHRACIEAALHGFSEMFLMNGKRVKESVETFLATARLDRPLREYAEAASEGGVL